MKAVKTYFVVASVLMVALLFSTSILAQENKQEKEPEKIAKVDKAPDSAVIGPESESKPVKPDDANKEDDDPDKIVATYTNYLAEYRLGPNDVVSIEVFGQCPDYCKTDVTVPPNARISYPLIREGIFVAGRTVEQIAEHVTKKLDEYIIDPKVSVTLVRAGSARYSVMGNVVTPGVRIMDRRISVYEAISDAGGLAKGANKKKILLARFNAQGFLDRKVINLEELERGNVPAEFLQPGDQVIVPGKKFTWSKFFSVLERASFARILFGSPF